LLRQILPHINLPNATVKLSELLCPGLGVSGS